MNEKELQMHAFCHSTRGRIITTLEIAFSGTVITLLVIFGLVEKSLPASLTVLFECFGILFAFWAAIFSLFAISGKFGIPSFYSHYFFTATDDEMAKYLEAERQTQDERNK